MGALVESLQALLTYARPQQLHLQVLDIQRIVKETVALFRRDERFTQIAVEVECGAAMVRADAQHLSGALLNLLINAGQAMDGMGCIEVRARVRGRRYEIAVHDHGPGMSDDVRREVFRPFFTTKSRGTGLGLPRVKQVVEGHGGSIEVDCPAGGGTRIVVKLPLH